MRSCCAFKCHTRPCFGWSTYSWVPMYVWWNQITQIAGLKKNCLVSRQYTRNVKIKSQIGFWQSAISFFAISASPPCTSVPTGCNFQKNSCSLVNGCNILQFLDFTNSYWIYSSSILATGIYIFSWSNHVKNHNYYVIMTRKGFHTSIIAMFCWMLSYQYGHIYRGENCNGVFN